jgi:hypothetical protein
MVEMSNLTSLPSSKNKPRELSPIIKERRIGRFRIGRDCIDYEAEYVKSLMGNFVILRAEFLSYSGYIEYHAYSPLFKPCPQGQISPLYLIQVENDGEVKAIKIGPKKAEELVDEYDQKG